MKIVNEIDKDILSLETCLIPTMGALHDGHIVTWKRRKKIETSFNCFNIC